MTATPDFEDEDDLDDDDFEGEDPEEDPNPDNYEAGLEAERQDREREIEYRREMREADPVYQRALADLHDLGTPLIEGESIEDVALDSPAPAKPKRQFRAYDSRPFVLDVCHGRDPRGWASDYGPLEHFRAEHDAMLRAMLAVPDTATPAQVLRVAARVKHHHEQILSWCASEQEVIDDSTGRVVGQMIPGSRCGGGPWFYYLRFWQTPEAVRFSRIRHDVLDSDPRALEARKARNAKSNAKRDAQRRENPTLRALHNAEERARRAAKKAQKASGGDGLP